ncbi:MAG: hypothetical protein IBJ09_02465 [Bacteroidia bacterium]|nr:hypothetical protein [Bacteroidia bacterium]
MQENSTWTEQAEAVLQRTWSELQSCAAAILDDNISNFPVFILSRQPVALGENISDRFTEDDLDGYFITASTAEDLIKARIIEAEKAKMFVASYKSPRTHACVLAIGDDGGGFIYFPYR